NKSSSYIGYSIISEKCFIGVGNGARDKLKELRLPLISSAECRSNWPNHFHEAWICTVGAYNEDACAGDSGGPLVKQGSDGRWELVGIAIAGTRRCSTDISDIKPGIYTKVAYYRDFIDIATHGSCRQ
uniref:Peptidase S1 domain-containing protein n=1 Tax=Ciona intestinalis TaxID=7719 RepID=H2Y270_CIOIN